MEGRCGIEDTNYGWPVVMFSPLHVYDKACYLGVVLIMFLFPAMPIDVVDSLMTRSLCCNMCT